MKLVVVWLTGKWSLGSMMKDFKEEAIEDSTDKYYVQFKGPEGSKLLPLFFFLSLLDMKGVC